MNINQFQNRLDQLRETARKPPGCHIPLILLSDCIKQFDAGNMEEFVNRAAVIVGWPEETWLEIIELAPGFRPAIVEICTLFQDLAQKGLISINDEDGVIDAQLNV